MILGFDILHARLYLYQNSFAYKIEKLCALLKNMYHIAFVHGQMLNAEREKERDERKCALHAPEGGGEEFLKNTPSS